MTASESPRLAAIGLDVTIAGKSVCRQLNCSFDRGEIWALMGQNGSGKSTLLATLAGSRPPARGVVLLDGQPLGKFKPRQRSLRLGWLAQHDQTSFPTTVLQRVLVGRHPHVARLAWEGPEDERVARQALAEVEMGTAENQQVATLSGGEHRRVAFAALLSQQVPILLLDEPLAQIDIRHQQNMLRTLAKLSAEGRTSLFVTHDPNHVAQWATHALLLLGDGEVIVGPRRQVLNAGNLTRMYHWPIIEIPANRCSLFLPQAL